MKVVKLTKNMLKLAPADLLIKLGATNKAKTKAYPDSVFISNNDYTTLKKNLTSLVKKEMPYLKSSKIEYAVGMELLNYGPNESLGSIIKDGYVLIDEFNIGK